MERTAVEFGGYASIMVTEPLEELEPVPFVATKRWVPSVFTMSGSSTPWTWTLVPVKDGLDDEGRCGGLDGLCPGHLGPCCDAAVYAPDEHHGAADEACASIPIVLLGALRIRGDEGLELGICLEGVQPLGRRASR